VERLKNAVKGIGRIWQMNVYLDAKEVVHQITTVQLLISALAKVGM
jgi:hypothetical protein